jgi:DnaK suppressor protein
MAKSLARKVAPAKKVVPAKKPVAKKAAKPAAKKPVAKLVKKSSPAKTVKKPAKPIAKKTSQKPATKAQPMTSKKPAAKATAKPAAKTISKVLIKAPAIKEAPPKPKIKREYKPAKLPAGYKPTVSEPYMNPQQEEYFRQKLLVWRKELMAESRETLDHLHEENWHQADIADRASLETEAGVELRTRNRYLKLVSKIDAAIRRIEEGDYGYCEETGDPIGLKRLEARPVATLSIEAQERHEKNEKQYTDED